MPHGSWRGAACMHELWVGGRAPCAWAPHPRSFGCTGGPPSSSALPAGLLTRAPCTYSLAVQSNPTAPPHNPAYITKLLRNYRSHPDLLRLPNQLFYQASGQRGGKGGGRCRQVVGGRWRQVEGGRWKVEAHGASALLCIGVGDV